MFASSLLLAGAFAVAAPPHSEANPVFGQLVEQGVSPGDDKYYPAPVPLLPDGLDAAAQRDVIESIARPGHTYEQFTRKSVVAPHVLRMNTLEGFDPQTPMKTVDIYFVAYGDMKVLTQKNFLRDAFKDKKEEGAEGLTITPEQLADRSIVIPPESKEYEGYGQTTMDLLNRVRLTIVGRSYWSQTEDSVVTAAMVDPRFTGDEQFANIWRPLVRSKTGKLEAGGAEPYRGAGLYMKMTELKQPRDAIFVEAHVVYAEPHGWFDGANLLGAKIPAVTQQKVREMRQEMLRAMQRKAAAPQPRAAR